MWIKHEQVALGGGTVILYTSVADIIRISSAPDRHSSPKIEESIYAVAEVTAKLIELFLAKGIMTLDEFQSTLPYRHAGKLLGITDDPWAN